jgi:hypothetical protein
MADLPFAIKDIANLSLNQFFTAFDRRQAESENCPKEPGNEATR